MVKTQPFKGFTLPSQFFQNYLENNTENIILKDHNAKSNYQHNKEQIKQKILEHQESVFIYQQSFQGKSSVGIVMEVSVQDYHKGIIKKHQKTLNRLDRDEITYRNSLINPVTLGFDCQQNSIAVELLNLENILLKVKIQQQISKKFAEWKTKDGRIHSLWVLNNKVGHQSQIISEISNILKNINCLYILDGHHRFDAAHKNFLNDLKTTGEYIDQKQIAKKKQYWIPGFIYPQRQVEVYSQHRVLKTQNSQKHYQQIIRYLHKEGLEIEEIEGNYNFDKLEYYNKPPFAKHDMVVVTKEKSLGIKMKNNQNQNKEIEVVSDFLDRKILMPIFNSRKDLLQKHLSFIPGIQKLDQHILKIKKYKIIQQEVKEEQILFLVRPLSIKQLFSIADRNEVLPPKSTWLQPKPCQEMVLRSFRVDVR